MAADEADAADRATDDESHFGLTEPDVQATSVMSLRLIECIMIRTALAFLAASAIATPAFSQAEENVEGAPAAQSAGLFSDAAVDLEIELTRSWLELSLVDYESAKFRNVRVVLTPVNRRNPREIGLAVCGLVNARNRMGGYNGFKAFYFSSRFPEAFRGGIEGFADTVCGRANSLNATDYTDRLVAGDAVETAR